MLSFDKLCQQKKNFSRLTGVTLDEFREVVRKVIPKWEAFQKKKKISGRYSKINTLEDEVLLVLIYYRFYVSLQFLEYLFGLDESNICRHIQRLEPMLADGVKIKRNRMLTQSDLETIIIDATEIQTQRPLRHQRQYYSGKKKKHSLKIEIMTDTRGEILSISKAVPGRIHDFKLRKQSDKIPRNITVLADSGYQGLQKIHPKTILPFKRRRKCSLSPEEQAHNRALASKRIVVEHVFAHIKKFKILGSVYRNFQKKLNLRFYIIAGIHNLKFS